MGQYASALSQHPVAAHAVGEAAGEILEAFAGEDPDLVVCFVSPHFVGAFDDLVFALGNLLEPGGNRVVLDGRVLAAGAVGVLIDGVEVRTIVSQGCRPLGRPYVVTRAEHNRVEELGGKSALVRLQDCATAASEEDRELIRNG